MDKEKENNEGNDALSDEKLINDVRAYKKWSRITTICMYASIPGAFALLAIFGINDMIAAGFASGAVWFVLAAVIYIYAEKQTKNLKNILGNDVILPILREVFGIKEYIPNKCLSAKTVKESSLVGSWDRINGSDYVEGSYRGIDFIYSDLHLEREEKEEVMDSDGGRRTEVSYVTVFKGQWLVCDFGMELAATVNVKRDKGWGGIQTENIEFNKKYQIYSEDPHTAFYLLTPQFMEYLTAAVKEADALTYLSFRKDGKVHIALNSGRDSFEFTRVKPAELNGMRRRFRRELKYLTGVMDELMKNDKLYKKQGE
jgi:hypothetical protein